MLNDLRNPSKLTSREFQSICALFIQDNLNSKSIDHVYNCKPGNQTFGDSREDVRKFIGKLDQGKKYFTMW